MRQKTKVLQLHKELKNLYYKWIWKKNLRALKKDQ